MRRRGSEARPATQAALAAAANAPARARAPERDGQGEERAGHYFPRREES